MSTIPHSIVYAIANRVPFSWLPGNDAKRATAEKIAKHFKPNKRK